MQPSSNRTSELTTRIAVWGPAAATPALMPAAYPALRPVRTMVAEGAMERTTSTLSSGEALSTAISS